MVQPNYPLPTGLLWQYRVLVFLQSFHTPLLDKISFWLSSLGAESFYLFALPVLFWSIHKRTGLRLTYIFLTSMFFNAWLKVVFGLLRPIGIPGIRSLSVVTATSYSLPSGHAQGPMTFLTVIARSTKRNWILMLGTLIVFGIGLSRLYLGLHWPLDVVVGWLLGFLIGLCGWGIAQWWTYRNLSFRMQLFCAVAFPVFLVAGHRDNIGLQFATLLLSIGVGAVLEGQLIGSAIDACWWKRICVLVIGTAGLIALQWVMKWTSGGLMWQVARDVAIGLWATLLAPRLFVACGLYHKEGFKHAN